MLWTKNSFSYAWVINRQYWTGGAPIGAPQGSHNIIPGMFPPDCVAKLKHGHFYSGLPKQLKAMVAYLKASTKEKTYSDYLWVAREAEKEEALEPSHNWMAYNWNKPKVMSFFPLQKLKGNQPAKTPAVWVVHLEQDSADKEDSTKSDNPDGIEGVMEEFIVCLAQAVKKLNRMKNAATTAVAQNILSMSAHW